MRGYFNQFSDVVDDQVQFFRSFAAWGLNGFESHLPRFLLGISAGGCAAIHTARILTNWLDKEFHFARGMWHILIKEPGNEKILADVIAWCQKRCPTHA
ncbi:MAG: hypothetical protein WDW36_002671 [Sanguina aurantia]